MQYLALPVNHIYKHMYMHWYFIEIRAGSSHDLCSADIMCQHIPTRGNKASIVRHCLISVQCKTLLGRVKINNLFNTSNEK